MVNHESIVTEVFSSPAELARLHAPTGDQRVVEFANRTGTVHLTVRSASYQPELISHLKQAKTGGIFGGSSGQDAPRLFPGSDAAISD